MPGASPGGCARDAESVLPRPASGCAIPAAGSAAPPSGPAAPGPGRRGSRTAGRDPELRRRSDRAGDRRRRRARREAGLCTSCGNATHPRTAVRSASPAARPRRAGDRRARYAERRAAGLCTRCARPAFGGSSRCGRCAALEAERTLPGRGRAASRKRYARRRARGLCVDCGVPSAGAARCPSCAYRSNRRARPRDAMLALAAADHRDRSRDGRGARHLRDRGRGGRLPGVRRAAAGPGGDTLRRPPHGARSRPMVTAALPRSSGSGERDGDPRMASRGTGSSRV